MLGKLKQFLGTPPKNPEKPIYQRLAAADRDGRYVNAENMRGSIVESHMCNNRCKVEIACHWINR